MAAKKGRPTTFDQKIADKACAELEMGKTLRQVCRENADFPPENVIRGWAARDVQGFYAQYARARDIGLDAMAEDLFEIADDGSNDFMKITKGDESYEVENKEVVNRSKLRVEMRKWYLSKLAPKRYGDKLTHELTGEDGAPVKIRLINDVPRS